MNTTFRTISAAGVALLSLLGGAAVISTTAQADDNSASVMPERPARAQVASCAGKAVVSMFHRAMDFQSVAAGASVDVEGSLWTVRGPRKGSDSVLVTLTSMASSGGAGELTQVAFYRDGVGTSEGAKYYTYNNVLDQASVQFCTKLGKGQHTFTLKVTDGGGGATTLYFPTVTYERFS